MPAPFLGSLGGELGKREKTEPFWLYKWGHSILNYSLNYSDGGTKGLCPERVQEGDVTLEGQASDPELVTNPQLPKRKNKATLQQPFWQEG